ncbi:PIN domain-like protein [Hymenopellis radicata]|nr:PIN domain-like protein [Hymenopellis radicata]
MGIRGLWKMLEDNGKETSLIDLSVSEGPGTMPWGDDVRGYRVGVDVSVWYYQANAHNRQTKNAALASLFKRATALFSLTTVIPLFVFDGPGRPNVKHKTSVRSNSHFLNSDFKSLIRSLGWKYAPGEAEAELAWMCADCIIDAVLTEDSDTFVFGAPRIIRMSVSIQLLTLYDSNMASQS